jgi:hypothetical protein
LPPNGLGLGLDTAYSTKDGDHPIKHPHGALYFNGEIDVTRGVDDIDAIIFPAGGNGRSRDGDASLSFLFHPIGDGGTIVHLTHLVDYPRIEKDPFCRRGLASINMRGNTDISNSVQRVGAGHGGRLRGGIVKKAGIILQSNCREQKPESPGSGFFGLHDQ